jgi:protein involved in sex pheromone biosynthesis
MKKIICILAVAMTVLLSGCGAGMGKTSAEVNRQQKNVAEVGSKQLTEDLNTLFHSDRPSRLTDKYVR